MTHPIIPAIRTLADWLSWSAIIACVVTAMVLL